MLATVIDHLVNLVCLKNNLIKPIRLHISRFQQENAASDLPVQLPVPWQQQLKLFVDNSMQIGWYKTFLCDCAGLLSTGW